MNKRAMDITGRSLSISFRNGNRIIPVLRELNFCAYTGEFLVVVGPSGCGKTTLLKLLAGLITPDSGQIDFQGGTHGDAPLNAMVFQDHGLFPWLNLLDNVAFGMEARGVGKIERRKRARYFLDRMDLGDFSELFPHKLSVGMRQRGAIARAFAVDPHILLMDEPFSALDAQTRALLQEELLRIWKEHRKTIVYVTHDIEEAILLGDRILVMTGRPGSVREEIPIRLPRPRGLMEREYPEMEEMKRYIWSMLKDEAQKRVKSPA